jgi:hypothetical protein
VIRISSECYQLVQTESYLLQQSALRSACISHVRFGSSTLSSKCSCFDVEPCDAHDQGVLGVAELYGSGIRPNIFGPNYDDPYQAITVPARPLEVGNPFLADLPHLPLEDWPVSRLIGYSTALALELVLPHRHDNSFSVAADSRQTEVTIRGSHTKMRKARR